MAGRQTVPPPSMLIYLASPYTHSDDDVRAYRCNQVQAVCAELARRRIHVISPIAHWGPIQAKWPDLPAEFEFWHDLDRKMIRVCDEFWILTIEGWIDSVGISAERRIAKEFSKPIYLLNRETLFKEPYL